MSGYSIDTYPPFEISWSDEALPALLSRVEGYDHLAQAAAAEGKESAEQSYYKQRNDLVLWALVIAWHLGYRAGFRFDDTAEAPDPEWGLVAYIELPSGQVSWHLPEHPVPWDGHTSEQKYERLREFVEPALAHLPQPPENAMRYGQAAY